VKPERWSLLASLLERELRMAPLLRLKPMMACPFRRSIAISMALQQKNQVLLKSSNCLWGVRVFAKQ
jgi:hypothetical protein